MPFMGINFDNENELGPNSEKLLSVGQELLVKNLKKVKLCGVKKFFLRCR